LWDGTVPVSLRVFLICVLVAGVVGLIVVTWLDGSSGNEIDLRVILDEPIVVAIDGAVATPGVYTLPAHARLNDVVDAAGGFLQDADVTGFNMAARVGDGESIVVPTIAPVSPGETASPTTYLINLNTASAAELDQLPGIGEVLAARIVDWRGTFGPFTSVDQLAEVEGISENLVEELRPLVTVGE
jgi:competence protein ComEA